MWDFERAIDNCLDGIVASEDCQIHQMTQHMGGVQCIDFSNDNTYICSLGMEEDNSLLVWDVESGRAVCGMSAYTDTAYAAKWVNTRNDQIVTAGRFHLRVWQIDISIPKMHAMDAKMGKVRRVINTLAIAPDDSFAVAGTLTGDIMKFRIERDGMLRPNDPDSLCPALMGITNDRFSQGVRCMICDVNPTSGNVNILVGAGDGTVGYVNPSMNRVTGMDVSLSGAANSMALSPDNTGFMVTTDQANRYFVSRDMVSELRCTGHSTPINYVSFPSNCSDLIVTSSPAGIRVWNIKLQRELLRIQVPNVECHQAFVTRSGTSIISGWADGKIRSFFPESGKLKFVINDAHTGGVKSLDMNEDDNISPWKLVSGGDDGRVRIWKITSSSQTLLHSTKEHRGPVNSIKVNKNATQAVSASGDGSCIVWDLERFVRIMGFFESTVFQSILYHPDESQMLTCGVNHKISYWDSYDGSAIRMIDGGDEALYSIDIDDREGEFFVSGSHDSLVKVWTYDEGIAVGVGRGHSGKILCVKLSPDKRNIITVGEYGEILNWRMPSDGDLRLALEES